MEEIRIKRTAEEAGTEKDIEIVLKPEEIEKIYRYKEREYDIEDIRSALVGMVCKIEEIDDDLIEMPNETNKATELSKEYRRMYENADLYVECVKGGLNKNDYYWESFWDSVKYSLESSAKDNIQYRKNRM